MPSQMISLPPSVHAPAHFRQVSIDGEPGEDLPPELFDTDEDREELAMYIHMAALAHDE